MTVPARITFATLGARDVAALQAFYERLGWALHFADGEVAMFMLDGANLSIYALESLARDANATELPPPLAFKGANLAINVAERDEVDSVLAEARGAGATVLAEAEDMSWGGRSGQFADPENNAWEVVWVPGSSFDDRGALVWPDRD
jgi:uncharacterized glyoxalase superfamily protein PhnB